MISVIMLTYNRENMVGQAIKSVINQTYHDFEYIIVDNGSTDSSGVIADEFAKKDHRIRVIHKERGNIGSGRNIGLDFAEGEYITYIDDDDWLDPDFLEFLLSVIREMKADIAICGTYEKNSEEKILMAPEEALIELLWRKKYNTGFPTKLFKRALFNGIRFSESENSDDIGLIYRVIANARKVVYYGKPKYHVYRHSGNNSAWTTNHQLLTKEILDEYLRNYHVRTEWLCKRFPEGKSTF